MKHLQVTPIGEVRIYPEGIFLELKQEYLLGLQALDGFSHLQIIWWFSDFDDKNARSTLQTAKPYQHAPEKMGVFATRSPIRPNPIALTPVEVLSINHAKGIIQIAFIDANDKTPILDIKPYTPSFDRVEKPIVPEWCKHWPISLEQSADFDWNNEFLY